MGRKTPKWKGKAWVKPFQDPIVKDVSHLMRVMEDQYTIAEMRRQTGMAAKTIKNMKDSITGQPHPTTIRFILRYLGKELVIRDSGENE